MHLITEHRSFSVQQTGAPNGSVPQNICSSCKFLLAGRCGRNSSPWKESVAGKKIIQGVRGDLKSRIAATGYLYGLLTTQDLNCALWNFPVSQVGRFVVVFGSFSQNFPLGAPEQTEFSHIIIVFVHHGSACLWHLLIVLRKTATEIRWFRERFDFEKNILPSGGYAT